MANLMLPGNPRYQSKSLVEFFGYDNLYRTIAEVEFANLEAMFKLGKITKEDFDLLTPEIRQAVLNIPTTQIDKTEREITKHDIRAWILEAKKLMDPRIGRWLHVMLTSYDPIETGRCLQYKRAFENSIKPAAKEVILLMADLVEKNANVLQIGRTHLQAALPITVGFWLATILSRLVYNYQEMERNADLLVGKISGAVGAYNAQVGLGLWKNGDYEKCVLDILKLKATPISTQILSPEPLAYFLHSCLLMSAALGQFGRDCRNLMRTEIAEVAEAFDKNQSGSSTMAHKRNPITFEGLEGDWLRTKNEYGKVLDTMISDLQRDLVGSRLMRDFPIILINLQSQMDSLLKKGGENKVPFLKRISIDEKACRRNFDNVANYILSEPLYIALQMYGYEGDAHHVVNHQIVPLSQEININLVETINLLIINDSELEEAWGNIPSEIREMLADPKQYTGNAAKKALEIAEKTRIIIN
ncbi:MAG: lyase family protein [Candidatus Shapirobacteria bacterium]|nr:lyase family protein [Candidatus Shapirobacteria bacterium]